MADNGAPLVLITRPLRQAERFAARCAAELGDRFEVHIAPLQTIIPAEQKPSFEDVRGLILTSENALIACPNPPALPAYCVGARTVEMARAKGLDAHMLGRDADELIARLPGLDPPGPLLHLHGLHTRGAIAQRLSAAGLEVKTAVAYRQEAVDPPPHLQKMGIGRRVLAPIFSPRSAALFAATLGDLPQGWTLFCLSPAVSSELPTDWKPQIETARDPTARDIITLMQQHISP